MFHPTKLLNRTKSDNETNKRRKAATPAEQAVSQARAETAAKQDEAKHAMPAHNASETVSSQSQASKSTPSKGANQMKPGRAVEIPNTGYRNIPNMNRQEEGRTLTVGRDISLNGEISACDHLVVEGTVRAELKSGESLDIMDSGLFNGKVCINNADIAGRFEGDLVVKGRLTVRSTGVITGNVQYGELEVEAGAVIEGTMAALAREMPMPVMQESFTQASVEPQEAANEDASAQLYEAETAEVDAQVQEQDQTLFAGAAE